MFSYLQGRSGRKEYWIGVGLLLLVGVGLAYANVGGASGATTFLWILVWNRRLHDIGKSGWIILVPLGLMIAGGDRGRTAGRRRTSERVRVQPEGQRPRDRSGATLFVGLVLVLLAIQFGFTIWLGIKKGDPGNNRFGPPPPAF